MKYKQYDFRTAYIDLLLNVLTGIIFLFILTTLLISPKAKNEEGIKKNAEFIFTAEWATDIDCDVDIWAQDPNKKIVYFQQKDIGAMHIERDDLGYQNDFIKDSFGNIKSKVDENKEVLVFRGYEAGIYTINLHLYSCRVNSIVLNPSTQINVEVKTELYKVNPSYKVANKTTLVIPKVWQEITVLNFEVDSKGNIVSITKDEKRFVKSTSSMGSINGP